VNHVLNLKIMHLLEGRCVIKFVCANCHGLSTNMVTYNKKFRVRLCGYNIENLSIGVTYALYFDPTIIFKSSIFH
jgi:hypothetical protein